MEYIQSKAHTVVLSLFKSEKVQFVVLSLIVGLIMAVTVVRAM